MRKEFKVLVAVLLVLRVVVWLTGCGEKEVHEAKVVPNVVRVYDVESQDRARISKTSYEGYLSASDQLNSSDAKQRESAEKIVAGYDEILFIHGIGEGIVKNAVLDALSKNKKVLSYHIVGSNVGCTVAKIKKKL